MMKVTIQEKFNTTIGKIIKVENDRLFKVGDVIQTDEGDYKIKRIAFSSNPLEDKYVNLTVS